MHPHVKKWLEQNPWFGTTNKIKTDEYLAIATAIRKKTPLRGIDFLQMVEKIWECSDLKKYPKYPL